MPTHFIMAFTMLLTFFFGLLHLLVDVCGADGADGDLPNLKAIFYTNPYPIAKPYNCKVIATLAAQGQCMSYMGIEETPLESLASCELYCYEAHYANTWDVSIYSIPLGAWRPYKHTHPPRHGKLGWLENAWTLMVLRAVHRPPRRREQSELGQPLHGPELFPVDSRHLQLLQHHEPDAVGERR